MEQKAKFVIIGLIGLLIIGVVVIGWGLTAKQVLEKEKAELQKANDDLSQKYNSAIEAKNQLQERVKSLNNDITKVNQEKEEVNKKYELLKREKEDLVEQLKAIKTKPQQAAQALPESQKDDSYWAGILKAKVDLELQLENMRSELRNAQTTSDQLSRDNNGLNLELKNIEREKQDLGRQLEYSQRVATTIAAELVGEKNDKLELQDILRPMKSENTILRRQLNSLSNRKMNLEKKLTQLQEDKNLLERKLNDVETLLKDQVSKINDLKQQLTVIHGGGSLEEEAVRKESVVELPPIVVRSQPEEEPAIKIKAPKGRVISVNKDNNFVIVDLGEASGIKSGDVFQVYRDNKVIAAVEVIQVRKSISACDIKKEVGPIRVGDVVK